MCLHGTPQVKIMKTHDPTGKEGPKTPLPDVVVVHNPKEEEVYHDKPVIGKEGVEAAVYEAAPAAQVEQAAY